MLHQPIERPAPPVNLKAELEKRCPKGKNQNACMHELMLAMGYLPDIQGGRE